jgi:hypothetical protein
MNDNNKRPLVLPAATKGIVLNAANNFDDTKAMVALTR